MPLIGLLLLELALRISGFGFPSGFFIKARIGEQQVCTQNPRFSLRFFPPRLSRPSCPMIIPAKKSPGTIRIFVLGGSAAMGDPDYSYGFSRMLEKMLKQVPGSRFEVFNVSITAINSHVVLPIARDCAKLEPDVIPTGRPFPVICRHWKWMIHLPTANTVSGGVTWHSARQKRLLTISPGHAIQTI